MAKNEESAMMRQYNDMKKQKPDSLLLFRCGDFYETYQEDAKECAKILGITLTKSEGGYDMAGFPHHALDQYLPKLIRAGKRVAICDRLDNENPNENEELTTNNSELTTKETMAKKMTAQEYVGKVIIVGDNVASITIKSADGDTLQGEFRKGDAAAIPMPMKMDKLEQMLEQGVWKFADATPKGSEVPKGSESGVKKGSEKGKKNLKPETLKPETKSGKLTYSTYDVVKKNKETGEDYTVQNAKIAGFDLTDAAYLAGASFNGGLLPETIDGKQVGTLRFSYKWREAAKAICDKLNAGGTVQDCVAIIEQAKADRKQKINERIQKREERKAKAQTSDVSPQTSAKGYSDKDVAEMLKNIMAGGDIPENIKKAMAA